MIRLPATPDPAGPGAAERAPAPGIVLAALSIPMTMSALDTSITNAILPTLARSLGAPFAQVQWVVLAYLLALTTLIVGAGALGDRLGRRRLLLGGIALFTVASVACGLATSLEALVAARAAQGLGAASMMALALAAARDAVPAERTGRVLGLLGTMSAVGTALGPPLGGLLVSTLGWRAVFLVNVPIGLVTLALVARALPADRVRPEAGRAPFDVAGTLLLAATLGAWALAMTAGRPEPALLLAAGLGAGAFVFVESRAAAPLVRLELLRERGVGASLAAGALVASVLMATLVVGPFHLARGLGLDAARVGLALAVGPLVVVLSGVPAGRAVDRFGAAVMTRAGLGAITGGALLLWLLPASLGVAGYLGSIAIVTAGYALFQTANNTAVLAGVPAGQRGAVSGLLGLSRNLGLVTGASALGAVFATAVGAGPVATAPPAAVAAGMRTTFAVATAIALVALALVRGRRAPRVPVVANRPAAPALRRSDWIAPGLLVALNLVPAIAGIARLGELASGPVVTPANARFVAMPLPVVLHILSVVPFSILGAFQFAPAFRRRWPTWHRAAGRGLVVCGMVAALTGLWMAHFYPWPAGDGVVLYGLRLVFGSAMVGSIAMAVHAIRRRDFPAHGRWMTRAYAIGLGAGTQALTHLPWFLFVGTPGESARAVLMGAGWVVNLAIAEWILRRSGPRAIAGDTRRAGAHRKAAA